MMRIDLIAALIGLVLFAPCALAQEQGTCDWEKHGDCDSASSSLHPITVNVTGQNESFLAYVTRDVSTFYQEDPGTRTVRRPKFNGFFGKFINVSPNSVQVYWDAGKGRDPGYIADINPFDSAATATYPGHKFLIVPRGNIEKVLTRFTMTPSSELYAYEDPTLDPAKLSADQLEKYTVQKNNLAFAKQYREVTGRDWLTLYGKRSRPRYPLWEASFFGQTHEVSTTETHFVEFPPKEELRKVRMGPYEYKRLQEYRSLDDFLNMTMTVVSCEPRVFEIKNFLSDVECDHILELATGMTLHKSSTRASASAEARSDSSTRTSRNTWVNREQSPIIDALYRRAADLLQIDEALLRSRSADEFPDMETKTSIGERLQLVHYNPTEQYTPHHDAQIPLASKKGQPMRYATILFYLNDDMKGGETSFPRYMNAENSEPLKVVPEKGKAVLFYNILPDSNIDTLSQHAALPVKEGEKWLTNLWVWDAYM